MGRVPVISTPAIWHPDFQEIKEAPDKIGASFHDERLSLLIDWSELDFSTHLIVDW